MQSVLPTPLINLSLSPSLPPSGVGKTTVIREMARVLADDFHRRVVIVDTSNELGMVSAPGPLGKIAGVSTPNSIILNSSMLYWF